MIVNKVLTITNKVFRVKTKVVGNIVRISFRSSGFDETVFFSRLDRWQLYEGGKLKSGKERDNTGRPPLK
jgi:hypothetical protein